MKLKKIVFCVLSIVVITAKAQFPGPYVVPNVDWINYYSQKDVAGSAPGAIDANSNVYTTGYSGLTTASNLIVLKYDSTGVQTYSYSYNNGAFDVGNAIRIDNSGNAYVAGISTATTGGTGRDYVVVKLNASGASQWIKKYDRGVNNTDEASDICVDAGGNVYVTGKSKNSGNDYDIVTLKLNGSTGSIMWTHTYSGSGLDDMGVGIAISANGQYVYVTGNTTHATQGSNIVTYALKASTGTYQWPAPVITNGTANGSDKSNAIIVAGSDVVICGEKTNAGTGLDYTTIKYNGANGTILWQQPYDCSNTTDRATALAKDSAGNIGVVGLVLNGSVYEYRTVLYSNSGTQYGSVNVESTGLTATTNDPTICNDTIAHHWYVAGEKTQATKDIFVYQISPSGLTAWRQTIDGQNNNADAGTAVAVNGVGVVYVGALSKNSSANYDYTTIKLNQTPVYWPPDYNAESVNNSHLYLKNQGQLMRTDSTLANEVLFYTHNTNPEIFIEQNAFNFVFSKSDTSQSTLDTIERIQYKFLGCNPLANHHEYLPKLTSYNYYLGYALTPEIEDIKGNERIFIPNYYPYIDLHYFSGKEGIKYYFVVKPGALLTEIRMQVNGATSTLLNGQGNLDIFGHLGNVELEKPIAYTVNWAGAAVSLTTGSASWNSLGSNMYSIIPPTYNHSWPLIIQVSAAQTATVPTVSHANLDYSTYYGGPENERFNDIKVANNGDRHVTGYTDAATFPKISSLQTYMGQQDVIFMKYTADDTLRYASFIGGSDPDFGNSIAVNSNNEVFVVGQTNSTNFRVQYLAGASNGTVNGFSGGGLSKQDGFLFKYIPANPSGQRLVWSRYFAGERADCINSVYVDAADNIYIAGWSGSVYFPTTSNASQPAMQTPWGVSVNNDAIFGKIYPNLTNHWITYCGSASNGTNTSTATEEGWDITVDNSGNVIGCGFTESLNTGAVNSTGNPNTFSQGSRKGLEDGLLVRYTPSGALQFRAYVGGNGVDRIYRLAHDGLTDNTYFAGVSDSTANFPFYSKAGATNSQFKAKQNAFIGYMDGNLSRQWCSYYGKGKNKNYFVNGLSTDNYGLAYLSGYTTSDTLEYPATYPVTVVYKDSVLNGTEDGYIAVYSPDKLLYNTHYFGGSADDRINNSDVGQNQELWVVGNTTSDQSAFPVAYTTINATEMDSTYNGGQDGFISGFKLEHYQVTGIKEYAFDESVLSVYPNPSNSSFNIEMDQYKNGTGIKVYNMNGQLIHTQKVSAQTTQINCESWANGVYLISVSNTNSAYSSFKFIKN